MDKTSQFVSAMRDFFIARNGKEMSEAYQSMAETAPSPAQDPGDWSLVEFAYNRLFVGPGPVEASPFASIYLEDEPFIMGETTLKIRNLYQMVGLTLPLEGKLPDDHISLEVDACLHMREGLMKSDSTQLRDIYNYFINEHMASWIPQFVAKVNEAAEIPSLITWVCTELENWLAQEGRWVAYNNGKFFNKP